MSKALRIYLAILLVLYGVSVFGISFVRYQYTRVPKTSGGLKELLDKIEYEQKGEKSTPKEYLEEVRPQGEQTSSGSNEKITIKIDWPKHPLYILYIILPRIAVITLIFGALGGVGLVLFHPAKSP